MATLAELDALIDANPFAFVALAGTYEFAEGGVPTINGLVALITNAAATNFGSNRTDITFNQENAFINVMNAHIKGNPAAAAKFEAVTAGGATLQDKLGLIYDAYVPVAHQTAEGRAFFTRPEAVEFYQNVAAERGVAGSDGAAIVALASLFSILVNQDIGLGDSINDLRAAIDDGSAQLPESGNTFTPIETADGTNFDADDDLPGGGGISGNFTDAIGEVVSGTEANDTFTGVVGDGTTGTFQFGDSAVGAGGIDTLNLFGITGAAGIPAGASISGVEIVNINGDIDTGVAGVNAADLGADVQQIWQVGVAEDISGLTSGQTAGFRGGAVGAPVVATVDYAAGVTSANVALENVRDDTDITITGDDLNTATVTGNVLVSAAETPGNLDRAGLVINIENGADEEITTLNLGLTGNVDLRIEGAGDLETLDASSSTGGIYLNAQGGLADTLVLENATFGSGVDVILADLQSFTAEEVSLDLGAGNDTLDFNAEAGGAEDTATSITLGAGADTIILSGHNITTDDEAGFAAGLISVTDFDAAEDILDLSWYDEFTAQNAVNAAIDQDATLLENLEAVAAVANANTGTVQFVFDGNLYIYHTDDDDFGAGDTLVELTGVTTLLSGDAVIV